MAKTKRANNSKKLKARKTLPNTRTRAKDGIVMSVKSWRDLPQDTPEYLAAKKEAMLKALEFHLGIVAFACNDLGVRRHDHYKYYKEDHAYKEAVDSIAEVAIDIVEQALIRNIKLGKEKSILFYLERKAAHRGYGRNININDNTGKIDLSRFTEEEVLLYIELQEKLNSPAPINVQ